MKFVKIFSQIDEEKSNKFPFVFLLICYWIGSYDDLGHKVISRLQSEDFFLNG